ncbi:MAG: spherulation-specific family 4 protein [Sulfuricurvum sp.]|nr:spherulation-specific family 4 protein [Sulfuricurvum sp.]
MTHSKNISFIGFFLYLFPLLFFIGCGGGGGNSGSVAISDLSFYSWNGNSGYNTVKTNFPNRTLTIYLNQDANFTTNAQQMESSGSNVWMLGSGHPTQATIDQWVNQITTYNASGGKVIGLSLDIEPWTTFANQTDPANIPAWQAYLDLVTYASTTLHAHGLKLSVSLPYWLDLIATTGFPNNRAIDYTIIDLADETIIMNYTNDFAAFSSNCQNALLYADAKTGKSIKLAIETVASKEPNVSFYTDPQSVHTILNTSITNRSFQGYVIHQLDTFASFSPALKASSMPHFRGTLIPLYTYPSDSSWQKVAQTAHAKETIAIINPNSGPVDCNTSTASDYRLGISTLKASSVKAIGYVYTSYGARSEQAVKNDIDSYYGCYPDLDGIFLDETNSSADVNHYYDRLYRYVKDHNQSSRVVVNPGVYPDESVIRASDTAVIYEDNGMNYDTLSPPAYTLHYGAGRFALLGYGATINSDKITKLSSYQLGYIYLTSDTLPNPWDTLTTYYDSLITFIDSL